MTIQMKTPEQAFNFTDDDLKANRKGALSERQALLIRNDAMRTAGIVCGCLLAVTILGLISARNVAGAEVQFIGFIIVACLIFAFWFYVLRIEAAIRGRSVEAITGEADMMLSMGGQRLVIGERMFTLTYSVSYAIRQGSAYTIYWLPSLRKIVSIESYNVDSIAKAKPKHEDVILPAVGRIEHENEIVRG
jgi:hypothetical protein